MEITSFVLGMLSIIAVAIVAVIVVGMLKINKLEKSNNNLQQLCRDIDLSLRTLISDTNRELTMVERTIIMSRFVSVMRCLKSLSIFLHNLCRFFVCFSS